MGMGIINVIGSCSQAPSSTVSYQRLHFPRCTSSHRQRIRRLMVGAIWVLLDEKPICKAQEPGRWGDVSLPAYHHVRWLALLTERLLVAQVRSTSNGKSRGTRSSQPCVWSTFPGVVGAKGITKGFILTLMIQSHRPVQPPPQQLNLPLASPLPYSPPPAHHHFNYATGKLHLISLPRLTTRHGTAASVFRSIMRDAACLLGLDEWL